MVGSKPPQPAANGLKTASNQACIS